jgi:hypothetical protein
MNLLYALDEIFLIGSISLFNIVHNVKHLIYIKSFTLHSVEEILDRSIHTFINFFEFIPFLNKFLSVIIRRSTASTPRCSTCDLRFFSYLLLLFMMKNLLLMCNSCTVWLLLLLRYILFLWNWDLLIKFLNISIWLLICGILDLSWSRFLHDSLLGLLLT